MKSIAITDMDTGVDVLHILTYDSILTRRKSLCFNISGKADFSWALAIFLLTLLFYVCNLVYYKV